MHYITEKVVWNQIRQQVSAVNPEFAREVDRLSPGVNLPLYKVRYPFGQMIYQNNQVQLSPQYFLEEVKEALSYRSIPMAVMLNRNAEVHVELANRVVPLCELTPGTLFGFWEAFESINNGYQAIPWNISAGSRTIFSLARLNDTSGLARLIKKYQLRQFNIRKLKNQWKLFRSVLNHRDCGNDWHCDVLFFTKEWFSRLQHDPAWSHLRNYCYQYVWKQTIPMRRQVNHNLIWQQFSTNMTKKGLRCCPYQLHTLKHIINLVLGILPCFKPAIDDASVPINLLQNILVEDYGLDYMPTIMRATQFNSDGNNSYGYYSINEPTLIESVVQTRKVNNIMQVSREIWHLLQLMQLEIKSGHLDVSSTPMHDVLRKVDFDVFHNEFDARGDLSVTNRMPNQDGDLIYSGNQRLSYLPFCYSASFLRGCVRFGCGDD